MASTAEAIIKTLMDEIKSITRTETILGDPINVGSNTIIPVCRIMVGFGAGGGEGEMKEKQGGSGGGGLKVEPAAFIVIKGDEVTIHGAKPGKLEGLFEAVPGIIEKIQSAKKSKKEKEEEEKK